MPGLSSDSIPQLQKTFGKNSIESKNTHPPLRIFLSQFPTFINGILFSAVIFSFLLNDYVDGFFILAIIFLNGLFGFIQEFKAEKSLEKLRSYTLQTVRVMRDGKEISLPSTELVPGDNVILSEGDRIPADGTLLIAHGVEIDESILTGESLPVRKDQMHDVFLGTLLIHGKGILEVKAIGMQTSFGQIAQTLSSIKPEKTPLQKQLNTLGKVLSLLALFIGFLLIPIGFLQGLPFASLLLLAISIAIAAIPEGLPAVITVALAVGTNRMAKRKAIVRQMPSVETLGSVQIILTDKTGTLTQNSMRVKEVWQADNKNTTEIIKACVLGNTASLIQRADGKFDIAGDTTDGGLLLWAKETDPKHKDHIQEGEITDEFVFDSESKLISTVWKIGKDSFVYVRGAPEEVLKRSNVSPKEKEEIENAYSTLAKKGLRVIGFAKKKTHTTKTGRDKHEQDLTFLGFVGLYDPPRDEVKDAILQAKNAGIITMMVTGDNELTALAIAKEIGLVNKEEDVLTGGEIAKLTDEELKKILSNTRIFARTNPHDKLRLTTLLQEMGYIVGVTGDGVNDALALKKADVGVAMGKNGTDVAKEASDIVITDDNFATIVRAIEEGRTIYQNIVKAILYLLTSNLSEISLVLFATLLGLPTVLLPTQILWINIATDGFPALSLAIDSRQKGVLGSPPRNPKIPLLTGARIRFLLAVGLSISLFLLFIYAVLLQNTSVIVARTIVFNLLVASHLFLAITMHGLRLKGQNYFLFATVIGTALIQVLITITPFFQRIFEIGF